MLSLKLGKFGAFLACNNYPTCTYKKQISKSTDQGSDDDIAVANPADLNKELGLDKNGTMVTLKKGPYGWYVQLGEATASKDKKAAKPKRSTIPTTITPDTMTLDIALKLLNLPILVGSNLKSGEEVFMGIGRFGPYLKHQNSFTSIPKNIDPFSIDIEQATLLIDQKIQKTIAKSENPKTLPKKKAPPKKVKK
jgi:DNA topoisomerase-1